jgi:hypothetical protein
VRELKMRNPPVSFFVAPLRALIGRSDENLPVCPALSPWSGSAPASPGKSPPWATCGVARSLPPPAAAASRTAVLKAENEIAGSGGCNPSATGLSRSTPKSAGCARRMRRAQSARRNSTLMMAPISTGLPFSSAG